MKILEIGIGNTPRKEATIYMDISKDLLKKCKGEKIVWDLRKFPYPFKDGEFDKIYFTFTLEYLERIDSYSVMKELYRIIRYYGRIIFETPNSLSIGKRIAFLMGIIHPNYGFYHKKNLTYPFMRALVRDVGFRISKEKLMHLPLKDLFTKSISLELVKV